MVLGSSGLEKREAVSVSPTSAAEADGLPKELRAARAPPPDWVAASWPSRGSPAEGSRSEGIIYICVCADGSIEETRGFGESFRTLRNQQQQQSKRPELRKYFRRREGAEVPRGSVRDDCLLLRLYLLGVLNLLWVCTRRAVARTCLCSAVVGASYNPRR